MKLVMKRDFQVNVVDVAMPIRRSNVLAQWGPKSRGLGTMGVSRNSDTFVLL